MDPEIPVLIHAGLFASEWQKLPVHRTPATADTTNEKSALTGENLYMKAAGIVRRIDD